MPPRGVRDCGRRQAATEQGGKRGGYPRQPKLIP